MNEINYMLTINAFSLNMLKQTDTYIRRASYRYF